MRMMVSGGVCNAIAIASSVNGGGDASARSFDVAVRYRSRTAT